MAAACPMAGVVPLVYSPAYNITAFGVEKFHPFDSRKYARICRWMVQQGLRRPQDFTAPPRLDDRDLRCVHSAAYLNSLRDRRVLARILELPIYLIPAWLTRWRVLAPMRRAASGTVLACRLALQHGIAINIGGGFHHAGPERGGGFCIYADVPLALRLLKDDGSIRSALVVDTDAHQGDGTADALRPWDWAHILDFYEDCIFPWPKAEEDISVPFPDGTVGEPYLRAVADHLPAALDRYQPDLVVYNAGSDVLWSDPLAHFLLTAEEMAERDLLVVTEIRRRDIPLAMVLSGGYGPLSWEAHARSIEGIVTRFDNDRKTP